MAWVLLRLALGFVQMAGAVISLALLLRTGVSAASLSAVALTCALTTLSVILFGRRSPRKPPAPTHRD